RALSAGFRGRGAVLRHHRDPRHPGENRGVTPSSPPGRDPRGRLVSPFTLHVLWPFLLIWAMTYRPDPRWGFSPRSTRAGREPAAIVNELEDLRRRVAALESSVRTGEQ